MGALEAINKVVALQSEHNLNPHRVQGAAPRPCCATRGREGRERHSPIITGPKKLSMSVPPTRK